MAGQTGSLLALGKRPRRRYSVVQPKKRNPQTSETRSGPCQAPGVGSSLPRSPDERSKNFRSTKVTTRGVSEPEIALLPAYSWAVSSCRCREANGRAIDIAVR